MPCAYCGERPGEEPDHVIPRSLFPKPRPNDMITVPACPECNRGFSVAEEEFRNYLGLHVGLSLGWPNPLWDKSLRGFHHSPNRHQEIVRSAKPVEIRTPSGLHLGNGMSIEWPTESHDAVLRKITRGLHYHHRGARLPEDELIEVIRPKRFDPATFPSSSVRGSIGGNKFQYIYATKEDHPYASAWAFNIHLCHVVIALVALGDGPITR